MYIKLIIAGSALAIALVVGATQLISANGKKMKCRSDDKDKSKVKHAVAESDFTEEPTVSDMTVDYISEEIVYEEINDIFDNADIAEAEYAAAESSFTEELTVPDMTDDDIPKGRTEEMNGVFDDMGILSGFVNMNSNSDIKDEEYEYDEESKEYDDSSEIDNSSLSFDNFSVCIRLNDRTDDKKNKLSASEKLLCSRFPLIKALPAENRLENIISAVFHDGFRKQVFVRNMSFEGKKGSEITVLGIRPEIYEGDFLSKHLLKGCSLLFKGHIGGKVFYIDGIYECADTECLDYEVDTVITPYNDMDRVKHNYLYDIAEQANSIVRYTAENLEQWKEYLDWKTELARRQIFGCKYFRVTFDGDSGHLIFWLVCRNQEHFNSFKKYLYRDVQAFNNDYSSDKWVFKFADITDKRKRFDRSIELGRFCGVVDQYYLTSNKYSKNDADFGADYDENYRDEFSEMLDAFETPYVAKAAFELNRSDSDVLSEYGLEDLDAVEYVRENVLGNYYSNGFLALSAVGDFVLIDRFRQAIAKLERGECYSPNLAAWLFNVQQARIPDDNDGVRIDEWMNPDIAGNENQREAVYKMLSVPDIGLIQGPPGTGKTTVIAEVIFQLVKRGCRVLVASQSNDAVDNALDRLADSPEIRAIRLGQKGKKRRKKDNDRNQQKFSEDSALQSYYHALSKKISSTWLDRWDKLEADAVGYSRDVRDARLFDEDVAELNTELVAAEENIASERLNYLHYKKALDDANSNNTAIQNEKHQLRLFEMVMRGESDDQFYLSDAQLKLIEPYINSVIIEADRNGISISPQTLSIEANGSYAENGCIFVAAQRISIISEVREKAAKAALQKSGGNSEIRLLQDQLQIRINILKDKIAAAMEDDDDDSIPALKKELKQVRYEQDMLQAQSSFINIGQEARAFLSADIQNMLNSDRSSEAIASMEMVENKWSSVIEDCIVKLSARSEEQQISDTESIIENIRASEGRGRFLDDSHSDILEQIKQKRNTLSVLAERYHTESSDADTIIRRIQQLQDQNSTELADQKKIRSDWETVMRRFNERLNDEESYSYDREYYQQTYLSSCNVVGISCTDNMKNLSDNGYEDFDVVIIDEVSKATPPELLIPLMKARKAILVGDHRQLPPMFKEHENSYEELFNDDDLPDEIRSMMSLNNFRRFKKMVTASLFKDFFENADDSIRHSLLVQYRMHSDIMSVINRFYDHRLSNGMSAEEENIKRNHGLDLKGIDGSTLIVPQNHAYWIDSSVLPSGKPFYEQYIRHSTSACNFLEAAIIIELLKKMADGYRAGYAADGRQRTVGVISFYQSQVGELKRELRTARKTFDFSPLSIDINTVDRFQGKEKNIVITSLVRNNKSARASNHVIAFERINVAFSRAQDLLVIVGAKHMYEGLDVQLPNMDSQGSKTVPVYKNIMEDLNRKACFKGSEKLISPELEQKIMKKIQESGETDR